MRNNKTFVPAFKLLTLLAVLPTCIGCASFAREQPGTASSSTSYYAGEAPSVRNKPQAQATVEITPELLKKEWGLADIIDLALKNNPATRSAWLDAKSAAARVGVAQAAFYPRASLDGNASLTYLNRTDIDLASRLWKDGASVSAGYLIYDFGGRNASEEAAFNTLAAANWTQNRTIQDTILGTQKAYYLYLASKSLRDTRIKALERGDLALKTAQARNAAGVATIADVLSTQTAYSQARLALETANGAIEITRGSLAVAMGLPSNLKFDVEPLPDTTVYRNIEDEVENLIAKALTLRPDLLAARAQSAAAWSLAKRAELDSMPTISLSASSGISWLSFNDAAVTKTNGDRREDSFFTGVGITFPLFTGYAQTYNQKRAKLDAESAEERSKGLEQVAVNQVFTAYHSLRTASLKVLVIEDLIKSAVRSEEVAYGRYHEGVGTILDLVTAQAALVDARTQAIQARWEWHTALAQLAHDTGVLDIKGQSSLTESKAPAK